MTAWNGAEAQGGSPRGAAPATGLIPRAIRAARLDATLYEEVEADRGALGQALAIVVLAAVAAGVGGLREGAFGLTVGLLSLLGWFAWLLVVYLVGTKVFPEPQTQADYGQLLRTVGFSSAPGVLRVFGFVPYLGGAIVLAAQLWMLVAMVVAVRQALDYRSTARAVVVAVLGWIVYVLLVVVAGSFFYLGRGD